MKHYRFEVNFVTRKMEFISAFGKQEAVILAQAKQINKGNDYKEMIIR